MVGGGDGSCSRRGWLFGEAWLVSMFGDGSFGLRSCWSVLYVIGFRGGG